MNFEQLKTEVLQLPEAQKRALHQTLSALINLSSTHTKLPRGSHTPLEELVWNALRGAAFPDAPSLPALQKSNRYLHSRIVTTARELETGLQNLFPDINQLQRSGVRTFFCHLAVSRLREAKELISPGKVLEALVPVEELCDDRFPGYRSAGVLVPMIMRHLTSGSLQQKSTKKETSHVRN